jgi:hypothetical protein
LPQQAKPVLWPAWNRLWVFKTWREYFKYSYCFEVKLDPRRRYILFEAPHGTVRNIILVQLDFNACAVTSLTIK